MTAYLSYTGVKFSKSSSTKTGSSHSIPPVLRALSEPVTNSSIITNIPKLDLLTGRVKSSQPIGSLESLPSEAESVVRVACISPVPDTSLAREMLPAAQMTSTISPLYPSVPAKMDDGKTVLVSGSMQSVIVATSVPVVLAQPVYMNTQILSGAYRSVANVHLLAQNQSSLNSLSGENMQLGSVVILGSNLTLPSIPYSSLLNPNISYQQSLTPTSMINTPSNFFPFSSNVDFLRSPAMLLLARSLNTSLDRSTTENNKNRNEVNADVDEFQENVTFEEKSTLESFSKEIKSFPTVKTSHSTKLPSSSTSEKSRLNSNLSSLEDGKEVTLHLQTSLADAVVTALPVMIPLFLYGHSYPSLHASTFVTFCCVKRPQPMYVQVKGNNRRVSMYSNWRLSKHNPNPVGLTSRMLLALYCSRYTSDPTYATCSMMQYSVTHSSYWEYHRNKAGNVMVSSSPPSQASPKVAKSEDLGIAAMEYGKSVNYDFVKA